jgi:predicted porin
VKKSTVALAIAGAFALPAVAQVPEGVQLYGRLNVGLDNYEAKGSALGSSFDYKSRMRVFDTASRVGIRGTEDVGGGFRAVFQIETGVNVDSGNQLGQNGVTNPNSGLWATRESWVGIEGDRFGRLTFGRQSVYWSNGTIEQIGANYINASSPFASYSQSGAVVGPVARESNTVQYSARVGGFSATASYGLSATSFTGASAMETAPGGVSPRDQFYALTLRYNHAVFDLQADWARRADIVNIQGRDSTGWKLGAAWKYMPGAQISVIYQNLKNDNTFGLGIAAAIPLACNTPNAAVVIPGVTAGLLRATGGGGSVNGCDTLKQDMWVISWEHTFGNFQALAQYGWESNVKGSSTAAGLPDSGAQSVLLGGRYFLSKRTWLYASWNKLYNDRNSYTDYWGGWATSANQLGFAPGLPASSSGADPQIIAVGIFHTF